jgi:ComF family protein
LPQVKDELCTACRQELPIYQALRSWAFYQDPLKRALLRLKYMNHMPVGEALANQAAPALEAQEWPIDLVVPIPLSRRRLRERGYNQVGLIAHPLAMALGLNYAPKALARWRDTHSQVGLTGEQRRENVRDVFRADGARSRGRTILLIDDIATTGSTISSAAEALLAGGASQVYAFTIARALHWRQDASA